MADYPFCIVDQAFRMHGGRKQLCFKIRWYDPEEPAAGEEWRVFPEQEDTWEPASKFVHRDKKEVLLPSLLLDVWVGKLKPDAVTQPLLKSCHEEAMKTIGKRHIKILRRPIDPRLPSLTPSAKELPKGLFYFVSASILPITQFQHFLHTQLAFIHAYMYAG